MNAPIVNSENQNKKQLRQEKNLPQLPVFTRFFF
jgi:hypothetical protein